ncbi:hypothetical protein D3C75_1221610 [compost metagenome]
MSPGLKALADGIFSAAGISITTLILGRSVPSASITPSTDAAPPISLIMSSMPGALLSEIPPVSKVMPLPMIAVTFSHWLVP